MPKVDFAQPPSRSVFSEQVLEARRFFLGPFDRRDSPVVVGGGFERVSEDYEVTRSEVPFVALELVVGGNGTATLDGHHVQLQPGTFFIYGQQTPHRLTTSAQFPLTKYFLDLDGERSRRLLRSLSLPSGRSWQVQRWLDLARLFEEIVLHGTGSGRRRQAVCDALLHALLLHAAQSIEPQQETTDAFKSYERCRTLIETAYLRLTSLEALAAEARLDVAYVCRLFQRYDGRSPYQHLLRKRMTAAAARLYGGDRTVGQVAREFGFADPFHFSRSFKAVLGTPPSKFRRSPVRRAT